MGPGSDPAVLLVHGFASSAEHNWRRPGWLDLLAEARRETIAVDLLGHGRAPRPASPAGYEAVEAHVAAAIGGREPVDAIGFSAGAQVLLRLAADQPGRFRRLALLGIGARALERGDPEPIVAALQGDPDPENVHGMVFRRLASHRARQLPGRSAEGQPAWGQLRGGQLQVRPDAEQGRQRFGRQPGVQVLRAEG